MENSIILSYTYCQSMFSFSCFNRNISSQVQNCIHIENRRVYCFLPFYRRTGCMSTQWHRSGSSISCAGPVCVDKSWHLFREQDFVFLHHVINVCYWLTDQFVYMEIILLCMTWYFILCFPIWIQLTQLNVFALGLIQSDHK